MPTQEQVFQELRDNLKQVPQQTAPPPTLLAMAKDLGLRVTSGYSAGGHNTGSMHYQGSQTDPGAIDIDNKRVTPQQLQAFRNAGYRVLDETSRPAGQAVWTGPHYHIDKKGYGGGGGPKLQKDLAQPAQQPTADLGSATPAYGDINEAFKQLSQGTGLHPVQDQAKVNDELTNRLQQFTNKYNNQPFAKLKVEQPKQETDAQAQSFKVLRDQLELNKQRDAQAQQPKPAQSNFLGDVASNFTNAATGYTQDDLIRNSGHGVGEFIGNTAGGLVPIGAGILGGGALGTAVPGVGNAVGAAGGGILAAGALGTAQDLQSQRLHNQPMDLGRALGSGAIQGALQAIPVVGPELRLLPRAALNAALQGAGGAAGGIAQQGLEQGTLTPKIDWNRVRDMAALGAAGGGVSGALHAPAQKAPVELAPEAVKSDLIQTLKPGEVNPLESTANPQELTQAFKQRGGDLGQPARNVDAQIVDAAGQPVEQPAGRLKSQYDIALERSREPVDLTAPSVKNALPDEALPQTPRALDSTPTTQLLDPQGRPLSRDLGAVPEQPRILDLSGEPIKPRELAGTPKDLAAVEPKAKAPQVEPTQNPNVAQTTTGKDVFTQGRTPEDVQRLVQEIEQSKKGEQLVNYSDAQKVILDRQKVGLLTPAETQKQLDTLNLFLESGRKNLTFDSVRREIKSGGEIKVRDDLNPFAITVKTRRPATEVSNLLKQLGSGEAVQSKMRDLAAQFGITPTTKTFRSTNGPEYSNALQIAKQLVADPKGRLAFTDVYLNAHNFKTGGVKTAFDAPRSYPLRTFEQAAIGEHPSFIPTGAVNQNKIAQQFKALNDISNMPEVPPELKQRVQNVLQKPYPSRKDIADMRKLLQDSKVLEQFCNIFGHGGL